MKITDYVQHEHTVAWYEFPTADELEKDEAERIGHTSQEYNTHVLFGLLKNESVWYETVREQLQKGCDLFARNDKHQTLGEVAGLMGRYDLVDLIERAKYSEV